MLLGTMEAGNANNLRLPAGVAARDLCLSFCTWRVASCRRLGSGPLMYCCTAPAHARGKQRTKHSRGSALWPSSETWRGWLNPISSAGQAAFACITPSMISQPPGGWRGGCGGTPPIQTLRAPLPRVKPCSCPNQTCSSETVPVGRPLNLFVSSDPVPSLYRVSACRSYICANSAFCLNVSRIMRTRRGKQTRAGLPHS